MTLDPNHPLAVLLQPAIMTKLTLIPIILQWVKPFLARVLGTNTGPATGIVAFALSVGLTVWGGFEARLDGWAIAAQAAIAFAYVEAVIWRGVIKPAAKSNNPVIPATPAILLGLVLFTATPLEAADLSQPKIFGAAVGVNGTWYDQHAVNDDAEVAIDAKASLSPHLSLVATGAYGFRNESMRYAAGVRMTVTDVKNPNLSAALGLSYRGSDHDGLKPDEWAPNCTIGYRPWPNLKAIVLYAHGWYGLDSKTAGATAGARYVLPL